jgi:hypothetical protein
MNQGPIPENSPPISPITAYLKAKRPKKKGLRSPYSEYTQKTENDEGQGLNDVLRALDSPMQKHVITHITEEASRTLTIELQKMDT